MRPKDKDRRPWHHHHWGHWHHQHPWGSADPHQDFARHRFRHYFGAHLHRRLFWWFGASILMTVVVSWAMSKHSGGHPPRTVVVLGIPALILWAASGRVARRIAKPLYELVEVT